jgi:FkbM family methyltransferase
MRGSTRFTFALARRFEALQAVPIAIGQQRLWIDLRDGLSHALLAGSPWATVPWEIDEQAVMRRLVRRGDIVFDIGAHIGLHTVLLSELTGPTGVVHAFEPNAGKIPALAVTVSALPNAALHAFALGERPGRATLFVPQDESMASLADWTDGRVGTVGCATCAVKRLDDLIATRDLPAPDFIKCDVEGSELGVLLGARTALDRPAAPIILYEANELSVRAFGLRISAATDFLLSLPRAEYAIWHVQTGARLQPVATLDPSCGHFNLVAIPASRLGHPLTHAGTADDAIRPAPEEVAH